MGLVMRIGWHIELNRCISLGNTTGQGSEHERKQKKLEIHITDSCDNAACRLLYFTDDSGNISCNTLSNT